MKKSLIALAVAGTFAAPAAFAATANVDVYGVLNLSYDYVDTDQPTGDTGLNRISSNSSRIGFKGTEDLGGGLKGLWQIEMGIQMDGNGNANAIGTSGNHGLRNSFVGLSGGFGTVLAGIHDTPYKLATGRLDPFGDTTGDYNIIIGSANGTNAFELRANNVLAYVSPKMSGFTLSLANVFGAEFTNFNIDGPDPDALGDICPASPLGTNCANFGAWSVSGTFEQGPLFASLAYEKHNNIGSGPDGTDDRSAWKLGLGYQLGDTRLGLVYEDASRTGNTVTDRSAWALNAAHVMGPITLMAAYYNAGDGDTPVDTSAHAWAIGGNYNLSKRTLVYARYLHVNNDTGATYQYGSGHGPNVTGIVGMGAGTDPSTFSLGVRHSF